ncbi:class I SAM-dependent methyltransferase [bacterium]|nr:class I SAM-dependent methyltransferase [bacterium]
MKNSKFGFLEGKLLSSRVYREFFPLGSNERVINIGCGEGPQAIIYKGQYGEMVGIDINRERIKKSEDAMKIYEVQNYTAVCANVEQIPLPGGSFDKAIAIDIIEHVENPSRLCFEANRLLKKTGLLLITFPAMHDKFTDFISKTACFFGRQKKAKNAAGWDPDKHNQRFSIGQWISIVESCGFRLRRSRATTLFPPLHLYGIHRFWFSSNIIHCVDAFFCRIPILKNFGQALVCIFEKQD